MWCELVWKLYFGFLIIFHISDGILERCTIIAISIIYTDMMKYFIDV